MSNFVSFLENLNLREKILFAILLGLMGVFVGFKFYENFLEQFVEETIGLNIETLQEKKIQINNLSEGENSLKSEIDGQNLRLKEYQKRLMIFSKNYEEYLDFVEFLSKKYGLVIKNVQNSYGDSDFFQKHRLNLELSGDFSKLLFFIQELENSSFVFVFDTVEFQNTKTLTLRLHLDLEFVVLK